MKATHLRAIRDNISAHMDFLNELKNMLERRKTEPCMKRMRGYPDGMIDAYWAEWEYLNTLFTMIGGYIDDLESEPTDSPEEAP